jgi:hypothetical protein
VAPASPFFVGRYAEVNDRIVRYELPAGATAPTAPPQIVVSDLPLTGDSGRARTASRGTRKTMMAAIIVLSSVTAGGTSSMG